MKVKLVLTEDMLGTACANPDVHREYIASKAPDAKGLEEEVAAIGVEAALEKALTVFPRENGKPFLWDYQIKGFLKESVSVLVEVGELPDITVGKTKLTKWTAKRIVDNCVFVSPRKVFFTSIPDGGESRCTRPIRAMTMQGERVSLITSESITAGAVMEFEIKLLSKSLDKVIPMALDYGALKGIGQWRNSGKGRFNWEEVK